MILCQQAKQVMLLPLFLLLLSSLLQFSLDPKNLHNMHQLMVFQALICGRKCNCSCLLALVVAAGMRNLLLLEMEWVQLA